jgi:uncharacterized membrane protein YfcA
VPDFSFTQWLLAVLAAMGIGVSKAGFAGLSLLHVVIFALLFGARNSTGVVLPMLIVGDLAAVQAFRQHARWDYVRRMLPPTLIGVAMAAIAMRRIDERAFAPIVGWIILGLTAVQVVRTQRPDWLGRVPHSTAFAWAMGLIAGAATMLANAAGPIFAVYAVAVGLPKFEFVGTSAWFFLIVNSIKVPFSLALGLIHGQTLLLNVMLIPAILAGQLVGRWLTHRIPQRLFNALLLAFAAVAALRLIGLV